jgi:hypothetical protein
MVPLAAAAAIGAVAGGSELAQRYRDRPTGPLRTAPGWLYIGVNALASVAALALVRHLEIGTAAGLPKDVTQVLVAGLGALAFFRSAFFIVRLKDEDVPLGPAAILQVILDAADRAYDRLRADQRSDAVARIMHNVSFDRAKQSLPSYCLQLMQNVSEAEQIRLREEVQALDAAPMGARNKSYNLGLLLLTLVGERTLETAIDALRTVIMMPNEADRELLELAHGFDPGEARRLLTLCRFYDPDRDAAAPAAVDTALAAVLAAQDPPEVIAVGVLALLRGTYGSPVLEAALKRLRAGTSQSPSAHA